MALFTEIAGFNYRADEKKYGEWWEFSIDRNVEKMLKALYKVPPGYNLSTGKVDEISKPPEEIDTQNTGAINLTSTPSGAKIYLDNKYQGIAPQTLSNLKPGTYQLGLTKSGYQDWQQEINVSSDKTIEIFVNLTSLSLLPTIPVMPKATEEVTEPSPTIQFRSLSTGTFLVKKLSGGYGELTIENGRDLDAVGVLASSRELKIPLIAVYIQSEDSFTIKGIEDDMYTIYFTLGEDWDSDLEKFTRKATYARFEEELEFETTETATEIRYMTFTVTLHPVVGGTAETEPVREADFPELSN